jgi:hypothetical protein
MKKSTIMKKNRDKIEVIFIVREWGKDLGFNGEIHQYLKEYFGSDSVERIIIPNHANIKEIFRDISKLKPGAIYFVDTRIFIVNAYLSSLIRHLLEAVAINTLIKKARSSIVCIVTDSKRPGFVLLADLLTHKTGIVVPIGGTLRAPKIPGRLSIEPIFSPISTSTATTLLQSKFTKKFDLYIGGMLYEPRKSYFDRVVKLLASSQINICMNPKKNDGYLEYLNELSKSRIVLNTNFIGDIDNRLLSNRMKTKVHMVGRNIEVLHAGALLMTQSTQVLDRYFRDGIDYVSVSSPDDAARKIVYFLSNEDHRNQVARSGQMRACEYALEKAFLSQIVEKIEGR